MPRVVPVSDEDKTWLRKNHKDYTYSDMAQRIGCCVDTLKRILVREGLQEFDGAKYQVRRDFEEKELVAPMYGMRRYKKTPEELVLL